MQNKKRSFSWSFSTWCEKFQGIKTLRIAYILQLGKILIEIEIE